MPHGRVKWFDEEKGFGFFTSDDGEQIFLHASALPDGTTTLSPGTRLDCDIVDGRKGKQVLKARVLEQPANVVRRTRKSPEDLVALVEDVIRLLDEQSNGLRRGRYPERAQATKVSMLLRAIADDLEG